MSNISSSHGALLADYDGLAAHYGSGQMTEPDNFPYAYSDWGDSEDHLATDGPRQVRLPLPPPGSAGPNSQ